MEFEAIIGLEVHTQLKTKSKMFCSCNADYAGHAPNTHVCPVCLAMPGSLPIVNEHAIELGMMTSLALNCAVGGINTFDRKNYHYPDNMKGYQITQFAQPIGLKGYLNITTDGYQKHIGITRVHLEEDVAKLTHTHDSNGLSCTIVDVNRSGLPLMEIVSEPDIRTAEEARQYLIKLRSILRYLDVSNADMEKGSFRCDANISLRPLGQKEFNHKVEVKNMNSFRAVFRAVEYEIERQQQIYLKGGTIVQETRGWVEEKGVTVSQRSKENANDYRYFPEPDIPPVFISQEWVEKVKNSLPELPDAKKERFMQELALDDYTSGQLTALKETAAYFEETVACLSHKWSLFERSKLAANWILGEVSRIMNDGLLNIDDFAAKVPPQNLAFLIEAAQNSVINNTTAKTVLNDMFISGQSSMIIIEQKGLKQISDDNAIIGIAYKVIDANPKAVEDYKSGKEETIKFLVGQVMRETKGQGNPQKALEILKSIL
ncbi:MAG: Asp-tRNA(Asn)/Glu-tRNA(Gln) amidotransferase subunit GatB [Chloroflexi bacterium]|nr:Asp-tRNA(Asn)/Glu-tRNA(Gln) amidotransferase subunit GatB [Chloroflexota bacterium]